MKENQRKLQQAIVGNNLAGVSEALTEGADPNAVHEPFGRRPLHLAAAGGNVAIVRLLLQAGADPLAEAQFGLSRVRADWMARAMNNGEAATMIEEAVTSVLHSKDIGNGEKTLRLAPRQRKTDHQPRL